MTLPSAVRKTADTFNNLLIYTTMKRIKVENKTSCTIVPLKRCPSIKVGTIFKISSDCKIFEIDAPHVGKIISKIISEEGYEINPYWFIRGGKSVATGKYIHPSGTAVDAIFEDGKIDFKKIINKEIVCVSKQEATLLGFKRFVYGFDFKE